MHACLNTLSSRVRIHINMYVYVRTYTHTRTRTHAYIYGRQSSDEGANVHGGHALRVIHKRVNACVQ